MPDEDKTAEKKAEAKTKVITTTHNKAEVVAEEPTVDEDEESAKAAAWAKFLDER